MEIPKMKGLGFGKPQWKSPRNLIASSLISFIFVFITHFSLAMIPRYFNSSSLLTKLSLSALLLVCITSFSRICKRLIRVPASAPAFVFFNILFIWGVFVTLIRKVTPWSWTIVFNMQVGLVVIGLYGILSSDPGFVTHEDSSLNCLIQSAVSESDSHHPEEERLGAADSCLETNSFLFRRVRYCKFCKAHVKGFDHHCPAFGNCIGQKNHIQFMVLLIGFVIVEASYIFCSNQFIKASSVAIKAMLEISLSINVVIGTTLFSLLQVMWQVLFLVWHIYCVCVNIRTDEWIKWKKYPEFQIPAQPGPGRSSLETEFVNPYDKGIVGNIKEFLSPKE